MSNHVKVGSVADFQNEVMNYNGAVLVDFWAEWCKPCLLQNPVLEELSAEQPGVKIVKVDVDMVPDLAAQNQIFAIPTMMFMSAKNEAGERQSVRQSGFLPLQELIQWMQSGGFVPGAAAPAVDMPLAA